MSENPTQDNQVITRGGQRFILIPVPDDGNPNYVVDNYTPFNTKQLRQAFLRKVYGILTIQLLVTFLIVYGIINSFDASLWIRQNPWILYLCMGQLFVTMIIIACCPQLGRSFPCNFIILTIYTISMSILVAVLCWYYRTQDILLAIGITIGVVAILTLFAFQTKWDFTVYTGFLIIAFLLLMVIGIVAIFIRERTLHIVYSSLVILVVCMAIVVDTQLMLIGKHSQSFGPDDYVFAALILYVDIVTLFIHVLHLIGLVNDN